MRIGAGPTMLPEATDYESLQARFRWQLPRRYNIAVDVCDRWAARDPKRLALIDLAADGKVEQYSFGRLKALSPKFDRDRNFPSLKNSPGPRKSDR